MQQFRSSCIMAVALAALCLFAAPPGAAQISARALPVPRNTPVSVAFDVNASGEVVGATMDVNSTYHAVLWKDGACTPLDAPNDGVVDDCTYMYASKVNTPGQVIGLIVDSTKNPHGFIWTPDTDNGTTGAMVDIGFALESDTDCSPVDINESGQVLASSAGVDDVQHGFLWDATQSPAQIPLTWTDTETSTEYRIDVFSGAINNDGQIVGKVRKSDGTTPAVLWHDGSAIVLTPGENVERTYINNSGTVAGDLVVKGHNPWLYTSGGGLRWIDLLRAYPELETCGILVAGINDQDQVQVLMTSEDAVVGVYRCFLWTDDGTANGFFQEIPISGIMPGNPSSIQVRLNNQGQVAGKIHSEYMDAGFYWDPDAPEAVQSLSTGSDGAEILAVSDASLIAGYCLTGSGATATTWDPNAPPNNPPVLTLPRSVHVQLGFAATFTATASDPDPNEFFTFHLPSGPMDATIDPVTGAFSWFPGSTANYYIDVTVTDSGGLTDTKTVSILVTDPVMSPQPTDLGTGTYTNSRARAVNASGQIVGDLWSVSGEDDIRTFLWLPEAIGQPGDANYMSAGMNLVPLPAGGAVTYARSEVVDINSRGEVVGTVRDVNGGYPNAFIWLPQDAYGLTAGSHLLNGLEGDGSRFVVDINDAGQVVVCSWYPDGMRGYLWQNGVATPLTRDGATDPTPVFPWANRKSLNENAQVAGGYEEFIYGPRHAVLWRNDAATDASNPALPSDSAALNAKGEIVGDINSFSDVFLYLPQAAYGLEAGSHPLRADLRYWDYGGQHHAFDINAAGRIIGWSSNAFLWTWENGAFRDIAPMRDTVEGFSLNAKGEAAGYGYDYTGQNHGYFWSDTAGFVKLPGLVPGATEAHAINDSSLVVGGSVAPDGTTHACAWICIPPNRPPELSVPAFIVGKVGNQITFIATATDADRDTLTFTLLEAPSGATMTSVGDFTWTPDATGTFSATVQVADTNGATDTATVQVSVWPAGGQYAPTDLGVLDGFTNSGAIDINAAGQVVGDLFNEGIDPVYGDRIPTDIRAFVWQDGVMTKLPLLSGYTHSRAYSINASGQIAGELDTTGLYGGQPQACLWEYDSGNAVWTVRGLGFLTGDNVSTVDWQIREPLNDQGQVACISYFRSPDGPTSDMHGFLWQDGNVTVLEDSSFTPAAAIVPVAINNGGQVIGSGVTQTYYEAMLWESTGVTRLTPDQNAEPAAINNLKQIVGSYQDGVPMIWLPEAIGQPGDYGYWPAGLSLFPEMYYSTLETINDAGQILISSWSQIGSERCTDLVIGPLVGSFNGLGTLRFENINQPAMNASGQVTGTAETPLFDPVTYDYLGSILCGFYASPRTGTEGNRLLLLGSLGGPRVGSNAINTGGTMAGYASVPGDTAIHACIWTAPPPTPQAPSLFLPNQISAVVGKPVTFTATATDPDGDALTFSLGPDAPAGAAIDPMTGVFTWTPLYDGGAGIEVQVTDGTFMTSGTVQINVYPAGTPLPLNLGVLPGFQHSYATGINASGTVIGSCYNEESDGEVSYRTAERAFVWQAGTMTELSPMDGYSCSHANAINALGQIVGYSSSSPGIYDDLAQACLWEYTEGAWQPTPLGFLAGREPAHVGSQAVFINDSGLITGESWYKPNESREGFYWQAGTPLPVQAFTNLPTNPQTGAPYKTLEVRALNNSGTIIGNATDDFTAYGPGVVWNANTQQTVKSLENSDLGAINTAGLVAGRYVPLDEFGYPAWRDQILFVWDSATDQRTELGNPGSGNPYVLECNVNPVAISNGGKILAFGLVTYDYDGDTLPDGDPILTAWLFAEDRYTDLYQVLDNPTGWAALSPTGKVAGYTLSPYAFFWDTTGYAMRLPGLGGMESYAEALNATDQVAGAATLGTGQKRAVLWNVPETPYPPTLSVPLRAYGEVNIPVTFTASATDPNAGDSLTFSLTEAPTGAGIDPVTGVFTWTSATEGSFSVTVQVSDGVYSDTKPVRIDVYPAGITAPASLGVLPNFEHSQATDINASGVVVGDCFNGYRWMPEQDWEWTYTDRRAFVWQNGAMTALPLLVDPEGLVVYSYSHANAINAQGQIVGNCSSNLGYYEHPKACLWEYDTVNARWTATALEWLTGKDPAHNASAAMDINAQGLIVGQSWTEDAYNYQWVIWRDGQVETFSNMPDGYPYMGVEKLGDNGTVIGFASSLPGMYDGPAVVWKSSLPTETLLERTDARPGAVNASGQVAGKITPEGELGYMQQYVFLWKLGDADVTNLGVPIPAVVPDPPDLPDLTYLYTTVYVQGLSYAGDILVNGAIGFGTAESGNNALYTIYPTWVYSDGQYTEIAGNLTDGVDYAVMSPAGYVAGWYNEYSDILLWDAFFWDGTGPARVLAGLGGDDTRAEALNDLKQVVGSSMTGDGYMRAVIWNVPETGPTLKDVPATATIPEMAPYTFTATATHPNPSAVLTFSLTNAPSGAAIGTSSGAFTWTPSEAQGQGEYTFTVTVTDDATPALSASKTVTLTVSEVNVAPVLTVPSSVSGTVGNLVTFTATATDPDIPGNALTFSLAGAPAGAAIDPTSGVFTWTPASTGSVTFGVMVNDAVGGTDTASVTITVSAATGLTLNGVPATKTMDEMTPFTFTAVATSTFPNARISYALQAGAPAGATINARTGVFTWTPAENQGPKTFTITVVATDRTNRMSASQSCGITVNEVNVAPVLTVPSSVSGTIGNLVTFTATATDPDIPANTLTFGPADNGFGGKIDPATGVFTWTPTFAGTMYAEVTVSDGAGGTDSKPVTIIVSEGPVGGSLTVSDATATPKNKMITATFTLTNPTTQTATDIVLTTATLGGNPAFGALKIGVIQAGASTPVTLPFKGALSGQVSLVLEGTCSLGSFARTQTVVLP